MDDPLTPHARPIDRERVLLLGLLYYIAAGLHVLFALIPGFYVVLGIAFLNMPPPRNPGQPGPPTEFGWMFIVFGTIGVIVGLVFVLILAVGGRSLRTFRRYTFGLVAAGVACLAVPLGTVLGVFTFLVLLRPGVRELFEGANAGVLQALPGRPRRAAEPDDEE